MNECTCVTFCNFGLPCRHIFACRKKIKDTVYDESLIPDRWRKEFEKQEGTEPVHVVQTSTIVNRRSTKQSLQPKSVIEKFNKAYDLCRDIAQFLSTCGEKEFLEKLSVLSTLKTEWQCSQSTKQVDTNTSNPSETIPVVSDDLLSKHNYENVRLKSPKMSTNQTDSEVEKQINPSDVSEAEELREPSVQNKTEDSDVLDLDDIRLDPVKSRRGRPKGTKKKTFWNFLKRQMWQTKRERQQRKSKIKVKTKILKVTIIQMLIKLLKMNKNSFG